MIKELFYNKRKDIYEWQEMPESKTEADNTWRFWYLSDMIHWGIIDNKDITPELCCCIIGNMRAAAGWKAINEEDVDAKIKEIEQAGKKAPKTVSANIADLPEYLNSFNEHGPDYSRT